MKWILGIDLRPKSQGVLAFARFLHDHAPSDRFVPVHVVPEEHLLAALRYHHLDEVWAQARKRAEDVVAGAGAASVVGDVRLERGASIHEKLLDLAESEGADGILVGRQAGRGSHEVVRLGKVARRLLRASTRPVAVVPPDLTLASVGTGPVLLLSRLSDDGVPALHRARSLADTWERRLVVAHAIPVPQDWGSHYLPGAVLDKLEAEHRAEAAEHMAKWLGQQGVAADETRVVEGSILDVVPQLVRELDPVLVVVGSRRLSMGERWLLTSVSSHLAGQLDCPVMVVPGEG